MNPITASINLDDEAEHVASFIKKTWAPRDRIFAVVLEIRAAAQYSARAWFDGHALWLLATELEDARKALLCSALGYPEDSGAHYYDALACLLDQVALTSKRIADAGTTLDGSWSFEERAGVVVEGVLCRHPELETIRPQGWADLEPMYASAAGWDVYNPDVDRALFDGVAVNMPFCADLPARLALPYVMAREKNDRQPASRQLIEAIFAHFLAITKFLNTEKLKRDLVAAIPRLQTAEMLFERDDVHTTNPFLKVAFELAHPPFTKAQFDESLASAAAFDMLSDEEKEKRQAEVEDEMMAAVDSIDKATRDKQFEEEAAHCQALLVAAFSANL